MSDTSDPTSAGTLPPGKAPPPTPDLPRNVVPWLVLVLLAGCTLIVGALFLIGMVKADSFLYLGAAAGLGVLASLLWRIVEMQRDRPRGEVTTLAWVAFPLSLLLFFGQTPLLTIAVYPPILEFFDNHGLIRAYYVEGTDGRRLEIDFPFEVKPGGNNLRLNDRLIPPALFEERSDLFEWRGGRILSLEIDALRNVLGLQEEVRTVSVNSDSQVVLRDLEQAAWPFVYEGSGARVQPITLDVAGAAGKAPAKAAAG